MAEQRVLVVDFASDARGVPCGRGVVMALPDGADVEIVRGTTDTAWADEAAARSTHVVLSGCDIPVPRDEDWFAPACREIKKIVDRGMPVLGVCFGHQIIVQALGDWDMVRRAAAPEYGIVRMRHLPAAAGDPLMAALPADDPGLYMLHMDEVVPERAVPALGLEVLAETERCAVHVYRLTGRPVWGIQGHPEIDPETMKLALTRHPATGDESASGLAAISRDVDAHPSCRRPELFDAFLDVRGEGRQPRAAMAAR